MFLVKYSNQIIKSSGLSTLAGSPPGHPQALREQTRKVWTSMFPAEPWHLEAAKRPGGKEHPNGEIHLPSFSFVSLPTLYFSLWAIPLSTFLHPLLLLVPHSFQPPLHILYVPPVARPPPQASYPRLVITLRTLPCARGSSSTRYGAAPSWWGAGE